MILYESQLEMLLLGFDIIKKKFWSVETLFYFICIKFHSWYGNVILEEDKDDLILTFWTPPAILSLTSSKQTTISSYILAYTGSLII